jgi:dihydrofolate reductase
MQTIIIAAVTVDRVIGNDGHMPWHYPADMRHFERTTTGHTCVMGRRTYESFPRRPLRNRTNIVLTRSVEYDVAAGVVVMDGMEAALNFAAASGALKLFVLGGARIYQEALPHVDEMILTHIPVRVEGDTYFPDWDEQQFDIVDRQTLDGDELEVVTYRRKPERVIS